MAMDAVSAAFNEYDALLKEKQLHKQQMRKIELIIFYFSSLVSLALYASQPDALSFLAEHGQSSQDVINKIHDNIYFISAIICIPYVPILCVLASFTITETFHVYAMGTQIGFLEQKINRLLGQSDLLTWENKVCPLVYGGATTPQGRKITNIIRINVGLILFGFALVVSALAVGLSISFLSEAFEKWWWLKWAYMLVCLYFVATTAYSLFKLGRITKAGSPLFQGIRDVHHQ
jgi:hypothetical protein